MSVTSARACEKSGVQAGVVVGQTSIVPGCIAPKSAGERITLAGAVTRPGLTAKPRSVVSSRGVPALRLAAERSIGPSLNDRPAGRPAADASRLRASRS